MKKVYIKPEIDLIDLEVKERVMTTDFGYNHPTLPEDFYMDATSMTGYDKYDALW